MNQIFRKLTLIFSVYLFLLISVVNSMDFILPDIPGPASCCGADGTNVHFQDAAVTFTDPSPLGPKLHVEVILNFGRVCDTIQVCLNENCSNPGLALSGPSYCPVADCTVAPPPSLTTIIFDPSVFIANGTNTLKFKSLADCSSLAVVGGTNQFVKLAIVTCGDQEVDPTFEDCDSVIGCDPNTCRCMRGYEPSPSNNTCIRTCGDGFLQPEFGEQCDGGAHCVDCACAVNYFPIGQLSCGTCGNNILDKPEEECDGGVGCANCTCTTGYVAANNTFCSLCGNNQMDAGEQCEFGYSGCNSDCKCGAGYYSATPPGKNCLLNCGNGVIDNGESCEIGGVGCSDTCQCQSGYTANIPPIKDCISTLAVGPDPNPNAGVIAGAVIGTVLGTGLIALGVLYYLYRRNKKAAKKAHVKSDKAEHEEELVDNNMSRQERVQTEGSIVSDRSGTQLTSGNDTSTTENSGGTGTTDSYLPTKSKTDLDRSEDILSSTDRIILPSNKMMLGKDKATIFYQALDLLHSPDPESEKKLHGLLAEASNNFDATRKQQAARSTSSSALKPNPILPVQPKSLLTTNEVMTDAEDNNNSNNNNNTINNNNNKLRTPPPKPPHSHLGGSPQPNPPKKRTTQMI